MFMSGVGKGREGNGGDEDFECEVENSQRNYFTSAHSVLADGAWVEEAGEKATKAE